MVRSRLLPDALIAAFFLMFFLNAAVAWSGTFHLDREWVKIWINQDGTIDLFYNITITLDSGDNINTVSVGQPKRDFTIGEAIDQYGNGLVASDASSGTDYKVKVSLHTPLTAGQTIWFTLLTNVAHMIYNDTKNPGNVGMQFIPTWWQTSLQDLRILIVLPPNVTVDVVKASVNWTNTLVDEERLAVYWEAHNLVPDQRYPVGVSFPKEYVQNYDTEPSDGEPSDGTGPFLLPTFVVSFFILGVVILAVAFFVRGAGKMQYLMPRISMETLGIRRGLTAVEASYLLDMKPTRMVTEILYSLLQKRAVWVEAASPSLKLRVMPPPQAQPGNPETPLRYYEIDFINAVRKDGTLDEEKLAKAVMIIRDTVEQKMRGYCRQDTVEYYKSIVTKAWQLVEQSGTPDLASKAYDEQLLWLLLDPNYQGRTQTAFRDRAFEPSPFWLWYWYGYSHYHPHPTYKPPIGTAGTAAKPPTIPGADFANNIATSVENTANNIVANLEKFANSILPMPPAARASHEPARHGASCVCACHTCACACACVSCACACASGGVG